MPPAPRPHPPPRRDGTIRPPGPAAVSPRAPARPGVRSGRPPGGGSGPEDIVQAVLYGSMVLAATTVGTAFVAIGLQTGVGGLLAVVAVAAPVPLAGLTWAFGLARLRPVLPPSSLLPGPEAVAWAQRVTTWAGPMEVQAGVAGPGVEAAGGSMPTPETRPRRPPVDRPGHGPGVDPYGRPVDQSGRDRRRAGPRYRPAPPRRPGRSGYGRAARGGGGGYGWLGLRLTTGTRG